MNPSKPYPLEAAIVHKRSIVEEQSRNLAKCLRERRLAQQALRNATHDVTAHREAMNDEELARQALLAHGSASVDLAESSSWTAAQLVKARRLDLHMRHMQDELATSTAKVQQAQAALARAHQELSVLESHRGAFLKQVASEQDEREQLESEDAIAARRPR